MTERLIIEDVIDDITPINNLQLIDYIKELQSIIIDYKDEYIDIYIKEKGYWDNPSEFNAIGTRYENDDEFLKRTNEKEAKLQKQIEKKKKQLEKIQNQLKKLEDDNKD